MTLILTPRELTRRAHFYQQFGQMTGAGISVVTTLETLERNPPAAAFRQPIRALLNQIAQGATVSDALRSLGQWLPDFDLALIQAGEHSGRLDAVLKLLASYYEDRAAAIRQMITDVAYPALVLHMAIFIFPMISLFNGGTMTGFVIRTVGTLACIYGLIFLAVYAAQGARGEPWRALVERFLRPVPVLGTARQSLALGRLAAALDALTNSGVNIIEAWTMAAAASGSPAIMETVATWKTDLAGGKTPGELVRRSPVFPELFANLYNTGEVSGQLDDSLRQVQAYYQDDGRRKVHFLSQWVPRFIYFLVAGFVGFRIISFYMGYFNQLNDIMK